jgi:Uma2 family endonuclease
MATAPTLLSMEQYLHTSYHPDADYVDGEIVERNLGEYEHGTTQLWIGAIFVQMRKEWRVKPVAEQRIRVSNDRVRICDIAVLRAEVSYEPVALTPPLICVEILSPQDRLSRAKVVLGDYLAMGVENIWLIDPLRRAAFTFDAAGLHEADPARLTVAGTPICVDLTEAFLELD